MLHNRLFLWPIIPLKSERIVKKETFKEKDRFPILLHDVEELQHHNAVSALQ